MFRGEVCITLIMVNHMPASLVILDFISFIKGFDSP